MSALLPNLERDLIAAAQRHVAHATVHAGSPDATVERQRGRVRRRLRAVSRRRRILRTVLGLAALTVASGAIAGAAGLLPPDPTSPSRLGVPASVPSDLASSFAILRRAREPAIDGLPAGVSLQAVAGGVGQHHGISLNLSRFAGTLGGTRLWLIPGSSGSCMYLQSGGAACSPNGLLRVQGLSLILIPTGGGAATFLGVLPDRASITATNMDGTQAPLTKSGAAYRVAGDTDLRSVTIHQPDGRSTTLAAPSTTAAPQPPLSHPSLDSGTAARH